MPFKSKAQQRFMFAAEARGDLKKGTAKTWAHHTKDIKDLPERAKKEKKASVTELLKQASRLDAVMDLADEMVGGEGGDPKAEMQERVQEALDETRAVTDMKNKIQGVGPKQIAEMQKKSGEYDMQQPGLDQPNLGFQTSDVYTTNRPGAPSPTQGGVPGAAHTSSSPGADELKKATPKNLWNNKAGV